MDEGGTETDVPLAAPVEADIARFRIASQRFVSRKRVAERQQTWTCACGNTSLPWLWRRYSRHCINEVKPLPRGCLIALFRAYRWSRDRGGLGWS